MKIYELLLKPISPWITDLTADTIFGHICWQIKYKFWKDVLEDFLKKMSKKPIFTLSDVLPSDRLPRPLSNFDWDLWEQDEEDFEKNKNYNWLDLIFRQKFKNNYLWKKIERNNIWEIKRKIENQKIYNWLVKNIENKNIIDRKTWITWENGIYSQESTFISNSNNELKLYIKIFNLEDFNKLNILDLLKKIFEIYGFWKKKSTWKWLFEIKKINENFKNNFYWVEKKVYKNYILLSNFIPSENDSIDWNYKIFTKFPKMWEENSIEWQNFYKKPLIMINFWSTFEKNETYDWYVWTMIEKVDFQNKWIYQYAYWFTLDF